jgi:hypothetical protein
MKFAFLPIVLLTPIILAGQSGAPTYYADSFRKGPTRIKEEKSEIKLTSQEPIYKQRLLESTGAERYELEITPKIGVGQNNGNITSWFLSLRDLRHSFYGNELQFDQELSELPKDNLYWLNPVPSAPVPIRARRIFKVDSFYLVFQVKEFRFTPADSPYLEFMILDFECGNTDPRSTGK